MEWWETLLIGAGSAITSGIFFAVMDAIKVKAQKKHNQESIERKALQALLRHNLLMSYKDYKKKGFATTEEKADYENMYVQYHALGKNGVMDQMHEEVMALSTEKGVKANG